MCVDVVVSGHPATVTVGDQSAQSYAAGWAGCPSPCRAGDLRGQCAHDGCTRVDALDARIIELFTTDPHVGVLGASRRLGWRAARCRRAPGPPAGARGHQVLRTADRATRARLPRDRLLHLGDPATAGHAPVVAHLAAIPEVLEIHSITGWVTLIVRVVARDNADLGRVIDEMIDDVHVLRANTSMCLVSHLDHRTGPSCSPPPPATLTQGFSPLTAARRTSAGCDRSAR